jgi:hypothetical protein
MYFDLLKTHIPKSLRAAVALVVMVLALGGSFLAVPSLLVPGAPTGRVWAQIIIGMAIGIPAACCFYYFQSIDAKSKDTRQIEIETLAAQANRDAGAQAPAAITAAYPPDNTSAKPRPPQK